MKVCLIGPSRFPIAEPFAGGLEAHTHALVSRLADRGHDITLFAAAGSDPNLNVEYYDAEEFEASPEARLDVGAKPAAEMREHHAYLSLMTNLAATGKERFDIVLNSSVHYLPLAMSRLLAIPLVTILHTPPTAWIESALKIRGSNTEFIAVSQSIRESWGDRLDATVVRNGVDIDAWEPGPGGTNAIWLGRIVPEKGTDFAIRSALVAGMPLDIAGPKFDAQFFTAEIEPFLGDRIRYLGHLDHSSLRERVRKSRVALVTPRWDEPYGLVAAEAIACGTPVAAFDRGAMHEILNEESGRLAPRDDIEALAEAAIMARTLSRHGVRQHAEEFCSLDRMVDRYEQVLEHSIRRHNARHVAS